MTRNKGFTLVEILIVVIILGILAAIVIPQFSSASQDARDSSLVSDLQTLRGQMELYNIQHMDHYPNMVSSNSGTSWSDDANVIGRLTNKTNVYGVFNGPGDNFGPYMQKFPTNSVNQKATIESTGTAGDNSAGWNFDPNTGRLSPDNDGNNSSGVAYKDL